MEQPECFSPRDTSTLILLRLEEWILPCFQPITLSTSARHDSNLLIKQIPVIFIQCESGSLDIHVVEFLIFNLGVENETGKHCRYISERLDSIKLHIVSLLSVYKIIKVVYKPEGNKF